MPPDAPKKGPVVVRLYFRTRRWISGFTTFLSIGFVGLWLGVLTRKDQHTLSQRVYKKEGGYWTDAYNTRGLWAWEQRAVDQYFAGCRRLLVTAAGGGREIIALRRLGIEVQGFESDPRLVRFANELLEREGMAPDIQWVPWDEGPKIEGKYDGVIVGWGAYMHIRGRDRRVKYLRQLKESVAAEAPILLSFYTMNEDSKYFGRLARVGNVLARVLRRDPIEEGDCMAPNYCHFFTRERLERELAEGGFEPIFFETEEYGHAVGRAV